MHCSAHKTTFPETTNSETPVPHPLPHSACAVDSIAGGDELYSSPRRGGVELYSSPSRGRLELNCWSMHDLPGIMDVGPGT